MTDELKIRQFQSSDFKAVAALWDEVLPSSRSWNDPRQVIGRKRGERDGLFFVGERDDALVATVLAGYDGIRGWIYSLAVSPQCRRQGIGRRMLGEAERALAARGCPKTNLQVRGSNAGVIDFYRRCGYVAEDRISFGKAFPADSRAIADPVPTLVVSDAIRLSQITWDDKPQYLKHLNQTEEFQRNMGAMPYPYTDIDADQYLSKVTRQTLSFDKSRSWAIRDADGILIGGIGVGGLVRDERAEIGYWLAKPHWGRGIVTDVVRFLCRFVFQQYGPRKISARAFGGNQASARVLRKVNFSLEGTLREHYFRDGKAFDILCFGMLRSELPNEQPE